MIAAPSSNAQVRAEVSESGCLQAKKIEVSHAQRVAVGQTPLFIRQFRIRDYRNTLLRGEDGSATSTLILTL
jgi:predicted hotdog family 3-hydroxylacyl-ACP dehydratase